MALPRSVAGAAFAATLALASGCTAVSPAVRQAAFDHRCEAGRIQVVRSSDDARTVEMDVCGRTRRYQKFGRSSGATWVDVTQGFPASGEDHRGDVAIPSVMEGAEAFARAVRDASVTEIAAFIDPEGVACVDSEVTRAEVERELRARDTWLHAYFLDAEQFRARFADLYFTVSFAELVARPEGLALAVPPGQVEPVTCVNFTRREPAHLAQLCFMWRHGRWVLAELPNCA